MRITNINEVDLNTYRFDHDLTMAVLLAHADGTVYHRYGGRTDVSPMSMESLVEIMGEGLQTHHDYQKNPQPPGAQPPLLLPELAERHLPGRIAPMFGCFHCHYAREARQYLALETGRWTPDQFWIYPDPKRIGLVMDQQHQSVVAGVHAGSPAEAAGIRVGNKLQSLGGKRVLTKYDLQWVLDGLEDTGGVLPFTLLRDGRPAEGILRLEAGWKVGDPADYSWRVRNVYTEHMIKFLPTPGFIGDPLSGADRKELGLASGAFALKITEINVGTHLAGVRRGDVVLSAGGKSDFASPREFYSWCELIRRSGRDLRLRLLRQGEELGMMVGQGYLNHAKVEKAPRASLGFTVQQLPAGGGLRVGHITEGCSAERAGVQTGDRIVALDGTRVSVLDEALEVLDHKTPGDLLTVEVTRDGAPLQFGLLLSGEGEMETELARLSGKVAQEGQRLTCVILIPLPPGKHVYSMHRSGFGVPTRLEFRGRGYRVIGATTEPSPVRVEQEGLEPMWILDGEVELRQVIEVTDPAQFQLFLQVYAQVCDDRRCHELRAIIGTDGSDGSFREFRGRFHQQPLVSPGINP